MKLIMSWSKVIALFGETGENEAFAATLFQPGVISDKSCSLATEDGDSLIAKATGGAVVGYDESEGSYIVSMRIKEMPFTVEQKFINATLDDDTLTVKSNIVDKEYSLKLIPKNVGAIGLKCRKGHVSFKPGYSEEEGNFVDLTYRILQCDNGELYQKFRTKAADYNALPPIVPPAAPSD